MKIGKPTHYVIMSPAMSMAVPMTAVCGLGAPDYWATHPGETNCLNCERTRAWKEAMKAVPVRSGKIDNIRFIE